MVPQVTREDLEEALRQALRDRDEGVEPNTFTTPEMQEIWGLSQEKTTQERKRLVGEGVLRPATVRRDYGWGMMGVRGYRFVRLEKESQETA